MDDDHEDKQAELEDARLEALCRIGDLANEMVWLGTSINLGYMDLVAHLQHSWRHPQRALKEG